MQAVTDVPAAPPLMVTEGAIEFDRMSFHYGKGTGVIEDLSLAIAPGERVGLVGRSGAGKTTLMNVLLRLFDLEGGRILIDGQDIATVQQESLRGQIGVVTQDTSLSGGQRQRIAVARMFLKDAPILVLDEATSALDSEVEAAIQEHLLQLMEGKTVIAIAHRLSTIAAMDRLVVIDKGRIVEQGSHDELADGDGLYADLWRRQSGGFIP